MTDHDGQEVDRKLLIAVPRQDLSDRLASKDQLIAASPDVRFGSKADMNIAVTQGESPVKPNGVLNDGSGKAVMAVADPRHSATLQSPRA